MKGPVPSLRIFVADDERDMREFYQKILLRMGHQVVGVASTGQELVQKSLALNPDLIISDIKMPVMDGIDAAAEISRNQQVPIILVSAYHEPDLVGRAVSSNVLSYLVKPIEEADLGPALVLAVRWSEEVRSLRHEAAGLRQALEDRKVIERAKGLLMKQSGLDEEAAFRRLQKVARDQNQRLPDVARMIVGAAAAFVSPEETPGLPGHAAKTPRPSRTVKAS
ncbi:MAG TPA: response regulator [Gemmataceae bacterium]|nr:response regulator [Gemmataceae bacterium]